MACKECFYYQKRSEKFICTRSSYSKEDRKKNRPKCYKTKVRKVRTEFVRTENLVV